MLLVQATNQLLFYGRFLIFQDGGRCHVGFWKFQIFNGWDAQEVELRLRAKFCRNRSNRG